MAELKLNIDTIVDIALAVERKVRTKYEREKEQMAEDLEGTKKECIDLDKQVVELNEYVTDLEGQKERQAKTITELTDVRDRQKKLIDDLEKHADSLERELEAKQGPYPATDEELQKKLDKAMDHIRRQGEEIDKLRAGAADPRWVPLKEKQPEWGVNVLTYSKRGTIYIAQTDGTGWKGQTGMISTPVAWMPMPKAYTGGEA